MPEHIIHKDGAFNVFSSVVDACYFEPALTRAELDEWYREEYGSAGMRELPARIERAVARGTSSFVDTIDGHIARNRCGTREKKVGKDEFIMRFLTLAPADAAQKDHSTTDSPT